MSSQATIKELEHLLADTYALYLKTQNYHWHVKGPHFSQLHELFNAQYDSLAGYIDETAERILMLGGSAPATFKAIMSLTNITDGDSNLTWQNMVSELASDQDNMISTLKNVLSAAQKDSDEGTLALASGRIGHFEKQRWFLENHLA